ncbi:MAG TPA: M14 family zinc carboxypeptidase [Anaerolineae bacterium]|nr:M14 family zinc carboxypeptidase [Anaerolineae bacterium]
MVAKKLFVMLLAAAAVLASGLVPALGQAAVPAIPIGEEAAVRVYYPDDAMRIAVYLGFEPFVYETNYREGYHVMVLAQAEIDRLAALGLRIERDTVWMPPPVTGPLPEGITTIPSYPCYRTVEETYAAAQAIVTNYPALAGWLDVGDSWQKAQGPGGYDMMVLKLTNSAIPGDKPDLFITAAIHAREYTTAETATRLAEYLVSHYETDADAHWLLDYHEIHMMLQANPDGRKKAETGLSWRKNVRDNCWYSMPPNGDGIDLNRNFAFKWGCCGGSSGTACSSTYRGTTAASEPETQAVQDYMAAVFTDQRGPLDTDPAPAAATGLYIDLHSYGELVLWPWGWTSTDSPNHTQHQTLGRKFAYFNNHTPQKSYQLYATDGTTNDHAYGLYGVAAYCIEMGTAFFQDCASFESTIYPSNLQTLIYAAKVARTPYETPLGPDALSLLATPAGVPIGTPMTLSATIDDTRYNNTNGTEPTQVIATAEYYVDIPPWVGGALAALPMEASDGSFDAKSEAVTATVDTTGWSEGRHILFVRGQDANGDWGAFSAIFVNLEPTAVELERFEAWPEGSAMHVQWETAQEIDNLGFNLYRSSTRSGPKVQLNGELIPTRVPPGSPFGAVYDWIDGYRLRTGRAYFYWLEGVDLHGSLTLHEPVRVRMP